MTKLSFPLCKWMVYFLASHFNMQAEHSSVILETIETLNTGAHMAFVTVSEIAEIVVISYFSKQSTASYKEVNSL